MIYGDKELQSLPDRAEAHQRQGNCLLLQNPMSAFNPMFTILKHICASILIHEKVKKKEAIRRAINLLGRTGFAEPETARNVPFRRESFVGRNAPCPFL